MSIGSIKRYNLSRKSRANIIHISPAVNNSTEWDLTAPFSVDRYGTYTVTPETDISVSIKMWGAAGGLVKDSGNLGGGGGFSTGNIILKAYQSYTLIIGQAGGIVTPYSSRMSSSGGGGTAMLQDSTLIMVSGAGGGATGSRPNPGGAGGGSTGESISSACGQGGTQTAPGAGGVSTRRNGVAGSGHNGGIGSGFAQGGTVTVTGGTGYGTGGSGVYYSADCGGGGGGAGYFGGGGGGGDSGGYSGGGGSGYINTTLLTNASTLTGSGETPANASDTDRGNAGSTVNQIPQDGAIVISLSQ